MKAQRNQLSAPPPAPGLQQSSGGDAPGPQHPACNTVPLMPWCLGLPGQGSDLSCSRDLRHS